jgi:porin
MYRLFGTWDVFSDGKGNSGTLIWKAEHRHAYGSNIPPGSLGFEVGYTGLFLPPFSDQGTRLTNLYWRQRMKGGNLVFVGGFVDVTDYVDVYMLASPWTGYFNFAFSTGSASIPVPNEGLGLALGGYLNDNLYLIAGFADSNSDPTKPGDGFDTFFNDREYFKHFELGWNSSRETAFMNNVHLTLWHADERAGAPISRSAAPLMSIGTRLSAQAMPGMAAACWRKRSAPVFPTRPFLAETSWVLPITGVSRMKAPGARA